MCVIENELLSKSEQNFLLCVGCRESREEDPVKHGQHGGERERKWFNKLKRIWFIIYHNFPCCDFFFKRSYLIFEVDIWLGDRTLVL